MTDAGKRAGRPRKSRKPGELTYEESLAHDNERDRRRWLMYATQDFVDGKDTPGARAIAEILGRVVAAKSRSDLVGDPLRLKPEHKKVAAAEQKELARKKKKGIAPTTPDDELRETREVHAVFGAQKVKVRGHHFRGLDDYQKLAIIKFLTDWEIAYDRALAGASWDPKVDGGGKAAAFHIARLEAQDRLRRLEVKCGERGYNILTAYAVDGIGPRAISARGGPHPSSITDQIKTVVTDVAEFYGIRNSAPRDHMIEAIDRARIELGIKVVEEAQHDLARGRQQTAAGMSGEESRRRSSGSS